MCVVGTVIMVVLWKEAGGKVFCFRISASYYCYNRFKQSY